MFNNKTVFITGSAHGIGAATARLAKSYGAHVILHDKEESPALRKLAKSLHAPYVFCDVARELDVQKVIQKVLKQKKKLDVLINCAGINHRNSFLETTDQGWLDVFGVNVLGTVHCCKAVIPFMQKNRYGRIVNVASIRGYSSTSSRPAYSASKAAIINLTATLAKEFAPTIAVNAVSPGFTMTQMSKTWTAAVKKQARTALLRRIAKPEEIAEAILFLASDRARFITGQSLLVDGGYSLSGK